MKRKAVQVSICECVLSLQAGESESEKNKMNRDETAAER